jgi:hypothetical protein
MSSITRTGGESKGKNHDESTDTPARPGGPRDRGEANAAYTAAVVGRFIAAGLTDPYYPGHGVVPVTDEANDDGWVTCHAAWHDDEDPSAGYSRLTAEYHDFTEGPSISLFDFHKRAHGVNFETALRQLAALVGIDMGRGWWNRWPKPCKPYQVRKPCPECVRCNPQSPGGLSAASGGLSGGADGSVARPRRRPKVFEVDPAGDWPLARLADELGVVLEAAQLFDVATAWKGRAWAFPERDADGTVIGYALRLLDRHAEKRKRALEGGDRGLAWPRNLPDRVDVLWVVEGVSDGMALLSIGRWPVCLPSAGGRIDLLVGMVRQRGVRELVFCGENDRKDDFWPGYDTTLNAAIRVQRMLPDVLVRLVLPGGGAKDVRAWLNRHTFDGLPWTGLTDPRLARLGEQWDRTAVPMSANVLREHRDKARAAARREGDDAGPSAPPNRPPKAAKTLSRPARAADAVAGRADRSRADGSGAAGNDATSDPNDDSGVRAADPGAKRKSDSTDKPPFMPVSHFSSCSEERKKGRPCPARKRVLLENRADPFLSGARCVVCGRWTCVGCYPRLRDQWGLHLVELAQYDVFADPVSLDFATGAVKEWRKRLEPTTGERWLWRGAVADSKEPWRSARNATGRGDCGDYACVRTGARGRCVIAASVRFAGAEEADPSDVAEALWDAVMEIPLRRQDDPERLRRYVSTSRCWALKRERTGEWKRRGCCPFDKAQVMRWLSNNGLEPWEEGVWVFWEFPDSWDEGRRECFWDFLADLLGEALLEAAGGPRPQAGVRLRLA